MRASVPGYDLLFLCKSVSSFLYTIESRETTVWEYI